MASYNPMAWAGNKFLKIAKSKMPSVSDSEQAALEAGTTGWEEGIFNGKIDWNRILTDYGSPALTDAEQSFLDNEVDQLCEMLDSYQIQQDQDMPKEVYDFIAEKRFLGLLIPEEYGGKGFSGLARSSIVKKISSHDPTGAITVMVPNSLGAGEKIIRYGTPEQKEFWLPKLASGEVWPCFALTELHAGSDALSIHSKGTVEQDEETGEIYINANFDKRYITLAPIADLLGLALDVHDEKNLLGKGKHPGFTAAIVRTDSEGVDTSRRLNPLNIGFMNGAPKGVNVKLDCDEDVIGGREMIGMGWPAFAQLLAEGRANSLPSQATAAAKFSARAGGAYSRVRQQFGTSVNRFKIQDEKLAEIAGFSYINDAGRILTNQMVDHGEKPAVPSAILKYHTTENARTAVNHAMDILGGKGIMEGPNNYLSKFYKGMPIGITVEGSNPLTRGMLIFGQGSYRLHKYLRKIKDAVDNNQAGRAIGLIGMAFVIDPGRSILSASLSSLTRGKSGPSAPVSPEMKPYVDKINHLSAVFNAVAPQMATYMGGKLKAEERHSAVLGDALSHLYLGASTIRHYETRGSLHNELPVAEWAIQHSLQQAQDALKTITKAKNSPFPWYHPGRIFRPAQWLLARSAHHDRPSFKLEGEAAATLTSDTPQRENLTSGLFISKNPENPVAQLERAFKLACETEHLEVKLKKFSKANGLDHSTPLYERVEFALAAGALDQNERDMLVEAQQERDKACAVDCYTKDMQLRQEMV